MLPWNEKVIEDLGRKRDSVTKSWFLGQVGIREIYKFVAHIYILKKQLWRFKFFCVHTATEQSTRNLSQGNP